MKKMFTVFLLVLAAGAFAQAPTAGFEILRIKRQTIKTPSDQSGSITKTEPKLDIEIVNTLAQTNRFDLDVIFIGTQQKFSGKVLFVRKLVKFPVALAPLGRQSVSANSIIWHDTHQEDNAAFPAGKNGFAQPEGWIVRAVRDGRPVKVETSGPAMARLAGNEETIASLIAGGSVAAK